MQCPGLADVGKNLLQIRASLVAVIEQQDAMLWGLALDGEPVGQLVVLRVAVCLGKQDAEVLDQHGWHVTFNAGDVKFLCHLMDDGCLATTGGTLNGQGTGDREQGLDGFFQKRGSHDYFLSDLG